MSLYKSTTFTPASSGIRQVDTTEAPDGHWILFHSDTYLCYADSSMELLMGTKFPQPVVLGGPPYLPVIPNPFYFGYRLFSAHDCNFYMNAEVINKQEAFQVDITKVHFYHLKNNKEIGVDTIKFIPAYHWGLRESEIPRVIFHPPVELKNKYPQESILTVDSLIRLRYNLHINTYRLKDGLLIRFEDGFIVNCPVKIPDIIFYRKDKLVFSRIEFAS